MKRVVAAYRVSTDKQGSEDDIPVQRKECRKYAEEKGWEIVEEIVEKVSGYHTPIEKREDLQKINELASSGKIDVLLVYHSDRIGRQTEMVGFVSALAEKNVEVYSAKEDKVRIEEHIDTLMTFMKFWTAEGESRKTSEKVTDAIEKYNEDGMYTGGTIPFGYELYDTGEKINTKKNKTIKQLRINEEESEIVKLIFKLVLDYNYGGARIAKYLNENNYKNRGKKFIQNTITRMLRNPVYMGYKRYNAFLKKGVRGKGRTVAPKDEWKLQPFKKELQIISIEDFKKTQEIMDKRKTHDNDQGCNPVISRGSKYALLPGIVYCHCGAKLKTDYTTKKRVRKDGSVYENITYRYRCSRASSVTGHGKSCWGIKYIDNYVEKNVLDVIDSIDYTALEEELSAYRGDHLEHLTKELKKTTATLKKKEMAIENAQEELEKIMMGESDFTKEHIASLLSKLSNDVEELKLKKDELEDSISNKELTVKDVVSFKEKYQNWTLLYKSNSHEEKQVKLANVVDKVVLMADGKISIHFKLGLYNEAIMHEENLDKSMDLSVEMDVSYTDGTDANCTSNTHLNNMGYVDLLNVIQNQKTIEFIKEIETSY